MQLGGEKMGWGEGAGGKKDRAVYGVLIVSRIVPCTVRTVSGDGESVTNT